MAKYEESLGQLPQFTLWEAQPVKRTLLFKDQGTSRFVLFATVIFQVIVGQLGKQYTSILSHSSI